ncbi:MAG: hypothetical protein M3Q63_00285 [bacterium]|nr:hypothetical protein [bacterium]
MRENKIAFGFVIGVILVIVAALSLYTYALHTTPQLLDTTINTNTQSFEALGRKLTKVEVWIIPTGSSITESDYQKLTSMELKSGTDKNQIWTAHVPVQPFLATSIFIRAYDSRGKEVGKKTYPYNGATEIYNAFNQFWTAGLEKATTTRATSTINFVR